MKHEMANFRLHAILMEQKGLCNIIAYIYILFVWKGELVYGGSQCPTPLYVYAIEFCYVSNDRVLDDHHQNVINIRYSDICSL